MSPKLSLTLPYPPQECRLADLSRVLPDGLPGGFKLGETVFYLGEDDQWDDGDSISYGEKGEVTGSVVEDVHVDPPEFLLLVAFPRMSHGFEAAASFFTRAPPTARDRRKHQSISKSLAAAQAEEHILRAQLAEVRERRKGRDKGVAERLRRLREKKQRPGGVNEHDEAGAPRHDREGIEASPFPEELDEESAAARRQAQEEAAAQAAADLLAALRLEEDAKKAKSKSKKKKKKARDGEQAPAGEEARQSNEQEEAVPAVLALEEDDDETLLSPQQQQQVDREQARRRKEEARRLEQERRRRAEEEEARDKAEAAARAEGAAEARAKAHAASTEAATSKREAASRTETARRAAAADDAKRVGKTKRVMTHALGDVLISEVAADVAAKLSLDLLGPSTGAAASTEAPVFLQGLPPPASTAPVFLQGLPPPPPRRGLPPPPQRPALVFPQGLPPPPRIAEAAAAGQVDLELEALLRGEVRSLLPGADDLRERADFSRQVEAVIRAGWEGGQLELASLGWRSPTGAPPSLVLFGSSASNLHSTGADLDMTLLLDLPHAAQCSVVRQLEQLFSRHPLAGHIRAAAVLRARVPIVQLTDEASGLEADISCGNRLGIANTALLATYMQHERARDLCFLVKHWAKRRRLACTLQGTPSSYAWSLLVVAHLQAQAPPVLPCLQSDGCWWQHRDAWVEGRGQSTHNGVEVACGEL